MQWYIRYKSKTDATKDEEKEARIRKLNLESDRIEFELSEKRLQTIDVSKIASIWGKVLGELKTNILNIPKQIGALFDTFEDHYDLEKTLSMALSDTLNHLSRADVLIEQAFGDE